MRFGVVARRDPSRRLKRPFEIDRRREVLRVQPPLECGPELVERVAHRVAGGFAEAAMTEALHELDHALQLVDLVARAAPFGDLVHDVALDRRPDAARRAEAATLVGEEMREVARDFENVAVGAEDEVIAIGESAEKLERLLGFKE